MAGPPVAKIGLVTDLVDARRRSIGKEGEEGMYVDSSQLSDLTNGGLASIYSDKISATILAPFSLTWSSS